MALAQEIAHFQTTAVPTFPADARSTITSTISSIKSSFDTSAVVQKGARFPAFTLPDAHGSQTSLEDVLKGKKGVLVMFYRGEWCPYCNFELRAFQQRLAEFEAAGVSLVAVSPELPNLGEEAVQKLGLQFTVLSDVGNKLAGDAGVVWKQPQAMREDVFDVLFPWKWEERYGDGSLEVPVPATFLVDGKGVVRDSFVDADWTVRLEPDVALGWVKQL